MWTILQPSLASIRSLPALLVLALLVLSKASAVGQEAASTSVRTPQEIATQILHLALHESVWGPAAFCSVRQSIELDQQRVSGFGKFVRAGEGSGKLKLSVQMPAGDVMNTVLQVSDGQRLHTVEDIGGKRRRSIVDLDKIRRRLIINNQSLHDPRIAMYLAIGGQAESLRRLSQRYEFFHIRSGTVGETPVWILTGRLAKTPPLIRAEALSDATLFSPNQSALLPTEVQVSIGKAEEGGSFPYWLYAVRQERSPEAVSDSNHRSRMLLVTEWSDPKPLVEIPERDFFYLASNNDPIEDETKAYLPPAVNLASLQHGQPPSANHVPVAR